MIQKDVIKEIVQDYYPEGNEEQILKITEAIVRDLEITAYAKIRQAVDLIRNGELPI